MTAETSATDTDSSKNFCFISYTNLAKFNSCLKNRCKILYQLAKINSAICCKVKQHFIVIKSILCVNQLHLKSMLANLLLADLESVPLTLPVILLSFIIVLGSHTKYFLQRMYHLVINHILRGKHHLSILNTAGSLHNYMIARFHFIVLRIEVIDLTYIPKSYAYYFCHSISP